METTSKPQRIEFSSSVKFFNLLVRSVEFFKYNFCVPKRARNDTDNPFTSFATGDEKVDKMGRRGTPVL